MSERIALIIGNSEYQDKTLSRLKTPDADVDALARVLHNSRIGSFTHVGMVIDQPAREIKQQIRSLFHWRKRDDLLLLYFSGQIVLDAAGQIFLAAVDTKLDWLEETAIPAVYITECMDRSFSRQQILILDCIHSSALAEGGNDKRGANLGAGAAFRGKGYWRIVLSASDSIQYALTRDGILGDAEHSVFTHYLVQGLETGAADLDGDGRIGIGELYTYVHDRVVRYTVDPKPRQWRYNEREEFIIGRILERVKQERSIKWNLIFGAIAVPTATVFIGGYADLGQSIGMAGLMLLFYVLLYWAID